jgi:hypothetical protein
MKNTNLPAWVTIWVSGIFCIVALFTSPSLQKDAFTLLTALSTGAFAILRSDREQ